jgi:hypothetical protein
MSGLVRAPGMTETASTYAKLALRFPMRCETSAHPLIGPDLNLFLAAFEAARKTRDEWQSARCVLTAHVASHGC